MKKMKKKLLNCKTCGKEIASNAKSCPGCGAKNKKPIYKRPLFLVLASLIIVFNLGGGNNNDVIASTSSNNQEVVTNKVEDKKAIKDDIPTEYKSALKKAQTYSDMMHMSKAGLYNQLTSEYGEQFSEKSAKYAIDNIDVDWNKNALKKAQTYQKDMNMSPKAIYDQLVSEYGEGFTAEEAQYAIDNLE